MKEDQRPARKIISCKKKETLKYSAHTNANDRGIMNRAPAGQYQDRKKKFINWIN